MRTTSFLLLLLISTLGFGQSTLKFNLRADRDSNLLWINTDQWIQSNSFPQSMVSDYMLSDRFKASSIEDFKGQNSGNLRAQVHSQTSLHYLQLTESGTQSFQLNLRGHWFMKGERNMYDLALFGNADYEDQLVASEPLDILNYQFIGAQYGQSGGYIKGFRYAWMAGLGVYVQQQQFHAERLSIYTAPGGSALELEAQKLNWLRPQDGIDGLGLDLDFFIHKNVGAYEWSLGIEDFNLAYGLGSSYAIDSSIQFDGLELQGDDLISGDLSSLTDSVIQNVLYSDSTRAGLMLMPFRTQLAVSRKLNESHWAGAEIRSWSLGKYGWSVGLWHSIYFGQNLLLKTAVGYGDYSGFWWSESARYTHNDYQLKLSIHGLHHSLLPSSKGLMGASLGLAKTW